LLWRLEAVAGRIDKVAEEGTVFEVECGSDLMM
jgi:hypothetical protein